jgi:hypothetical protein
MNNLLQRLLEQLRVFYESLPDPLKASLPELLGGLVLQPYLTIEPHWRMI